MKSKLKKIVTYGLFTISISALAIISYQCIGIKHCSYCGEYYDTKKNIMLEIKEERQDKNICDTCQGYTEALNRMGEK